MPAGKAWPPLLSPSLPPPWGLVPDCATGSARRRREPRDLPAGPTRSRIRQGGKRGAAPVPPSAASHPRNAGRGVAGPRAEPPSRPRRLSGAPAPLCRCRLGRERGRPRSSRAQIPPAGTGRRGAPFLVQLCRRSPRAGARSSHGQEAGERPRTPATLPRAGGPRQPPSSAGKRALRRLSGPRRGQTGRTPTAPTAGRQAWYPEGQSPHPPPGMLAGPAALLQPPQKYRP